MKVKLSQRILSTILTFAVLFSMVSMTIVTTNAASDDVYDITILDVTRKYSIAGEIAEAINNKRKASNLPELILNDVLVEESMIRAAELSIRVDNGKTLSGEPYSDIDEDCYYYEGVLSSTGTVANIVSNLSSDVVYNTNSITIGVGVVTVNGNTNKKYVCVRTTDYYTEDDSAGDPTISETKQRADEYGEFGDGEQEVTALESLISSKLSLYIDNKATAATTYSMDKGDTVSFLYKAGDAYIRPDIGLSSNSIFTRNSDGSLTAKAAGTEVVSVRVSEYSSKSYTKQITITVKSDEPEMKPTLSLSASKGLINKEVTGSVSVENGTGPYTYTFEYTSVYSGGTTGSKISNDAAVASKFSFTPTWVGTYTFKVTVVDSKGNTNFATQTYEVVDNFSVSLSATRNSIALGNSLTLTATPTGGYTPITYQFSYEGGSATLTQDSSSPNKAVFTPSSTSDKFTVTVKATDSSNNTATASYTISVKSSLTTTLTADKNMLKSTLTANLTASASGGVGTLNYKFTYTSTEGGEATITQGIDSAKNTAAFKPTKAGTYTVKVTVTDSIGNEDSATKLIYVSDGISVSLAASPTLAAVNGTVTLTATPSGALGNVTYKYEYSDGTAISGTGSKVTVTQSRSGEYTVKVTATDEVGYSATGETKFTVTDSLGVMLAASKETINVGDSITLTATAVGGSGVSYTFSGASGITASGNIATFKPTAAGDYTITVTAKDSSGSTATATQKIKVYNKLTVTLASEKTEVAKDAKVVFSATASGGSGTKTYTFNYNGKSVDNGEKSFTTITADTAGTLSVTVTVKDENGYTATSAACSVTVVGELDVSLTTDSSDKSYKINVGESITLVASSTGGYQPVTYSFTSNDVACTSANGFTVDGNKVTFKPTATGSYEIRVTATDRLNNSLQTSRTVTVSTGSSVSNLKVTLTAASGNYYANDTVTFTSKATGGSGSYKYSYTCDGKEVGYTMTAAVSSIALASGTHTMYVTVTDGSGNTAKSDTVSVYVAATMGSGKMTSNSEYVELGKSVTFSASATGGYTPYTYTFTDSEGKTLSSDSTSASVTATPTKTGTYTVKAVIKDKYGKTVNVSKSVTVAKKIGATLSADKTTVAAGEKVTLTAKTSDGFGSVKYSYAYKNGTAISGSSNTTTITPSTVGSYTVVLTVTDAGGSSNTAEVTITVVAKPTVTLTADKTTIAVGETVKLTASATGGVSTITYSYSTATGLTANGATATYKPTAAGSVTIKVTATDKNGNTATASKKITTNAALSVSLSATKETITVGDSTTLTATATGGVSTITYTYSSVTGLTASGAKATYTPTAAGEVTITVTAKDSNGNTATASKKITAVTTPTVTLSASKETIAVGETVTLTASAAGGTSPYTYTYSSATGLTANGATATYKPTTAGSYTITVTAKDKNGTEVKASKTITVKAALSVSLSASKETITVGDSTTLTATATGGVSTITYTYSTATGLTANGATATYKPTTAGSYTITVTAKDSNGNTATASKKITAVTTPTVTLSASKETIAVGETVTLTASAAGGTSPYTYTYSSATGLTANGATATYKPTTAGSYTITVTAKDSNGNTATSSKTIKVVTKPTATLSASKETIILGETVTLTASVAGGTSPYTYTYSSAAGLTSNGATATYKPTTAGSVMITVKVKDQNGTEVEATKIITAVAKLSVELKADPTLTTVGNTITFTATPTGGSGTISYSYKYKNSSAISGTGKSVSITPSTAGTYTVEVTAKDGENQTATAEASVTVTNKLAVSLSATKDKVLVDGTTTLTASAVGGTAPYTYKYTTLTGLTANGAAATFKPSSAANAAITVTVTDKNGNTATASKTITVAQKLSVSLAASASTVNTGSSVTLTATPTGGFTPITYSYAYSDGTAISGTSNKVTITPSKADSYIVIVTATDNEGNTATGNVSFNVVDVLKVSLASTVSQIGVGDTAVLTASASGGTEPYTYTYSSASGLTSNGAIATYNPTAAGDVTITVTVKDKNNKTATATKTIKVINKLSVSLTATPSSVATNSTVTLKATPTGGSGTITYKYEYDNGTAISGTTNSTTVTPTKAGTYKVKVTATDTAKQTATAETTFTVTDKLEISAFTAAKTSVNTGDSTTVTATAKGPSSISYTFTCNNTALAITANGNKATVTPTAAGTYTITVKAIDNNNANNTATKTVTITATDKLSVSLSATPAVVTINNTVTLKAAATGGSGTITYKYAYNDGTAIPGTSASTTVTPSKTGTYNVTVTATDTAGNTAKATASFTVTDKLAVSLSAESTMVNIGESTTLTAVAAGGTSPITYTYSTAAGLTATGSTATFKPSTAGNNTITVTATDKNGNTAKASVTVKSAYKLSVKLNADKTELIAGYSVRLTATPTGGFAPVTYKYSYKGGAAIAGTTSVTTAVPTTAGTYTVTVTAIDASGTTATSDVTFTVYDKLTVSLDTTSTMVNVGDTATLTATASGGAPTITYAYSSTTGLTANGSKATYKPSSATSVNITVTAVDKLGNKVSATKTIKSENKLSVKLTADKTAVNTGGSIALTATPTGGFTPITYSYTYSDGTAISGTGNRVSVTPSKAGSYTVIVTAKDSANNTAVSEVSFVITDKIEISSFETSSTMVNVGDTATLTAAIKGGSSSVSYAFTSNNSAAVINQNGNKATFRPTAAGSYTVTVKVTDNNNSNNTATKTVTIKSAEKLSVSLEANTSVIATGSSVTLKSVTTGGFTPITYSYAYKNGTAITGTSASVTVKPTATGIQTVVVTATDANKNVAKAEVSFNVTDKVEVTSLTAAKTMVNLNDSTVLTAAAKGGTSSISYTFSCSNKSVVITSDGNKATVTPTAAGSYTITVKATDDNNTSNTATKTITIKAASKLTLGIAATPAIVTVGESVPLHALPSGGFSPITYKYVYNDGTVISGTGVSTSTKPTKAGVHTITVTATDAAGNTASAQTTFTVADKLEVILETNKNMVSIGDQTELIATAAGGTAPITYTYSTTSGLTANGNTATFKPTTAGNITITVTAHDSNNKTATAKLTVKTANKLTVGLAADKTAVIAGEKITLTATPKNGFGSVTYKYTYKDGTAILGTANKTTVTPTEPGTYTIIVTATDAGNYTATSEVTVTVAAKPEVTLSAAKDSIYVNESTTLTASAKGGISTITYSYSGASGITANGSTATFKPTSAGNYTITVTAKDSKGNTATAKITVKVTAAVVNNSSVSATSATVGQKIVVKGAANGGTAPYAYAFYYKKSTDTAWTTAGTAFSSDKANLQFTTAGTYNVKVKVIDANGRSAEKTFTITVK